MNGGPSFQHSWMKINRFDIYRCKIWWKKVGVFRCPVGVFRCPVGVFTRPGFLVQFGYFFLCSNHHWKSKSPNDFALNQNRSILHQGARMCSQLPSRAWSCETLQRGLGLATAVPLMLDSLGETDLEAMQAELARLQEGLVVDCGFHQQGNWTIISIAVDYTYSLIVSSCPMLPPCHQPCHPRQRKQQRRRPPFLRKRNPSPLLRAMALKARIEFDWLLSV